MNPKKPKNTTRAVVKVQQKYSELVTLRAAVQSIPYVGGTLDTLFAGRAMQIQMARVEDFLAELHGRLERVEHAAANLEDEAFSDLVIATLEKVSHARSPKKRSRFAQILSRQVKQEGIGKKPRTQPV